ncbi:MAG: putative photosynthetic complex assembly protein PuhE [Burkholderiaceae bacterium]|nr:putative photosynthetic complex assembly protein PuhE [Burkholderiaceae bacterium]
MLELIAPVVFAAFMWWFSTGIVLLLDGLPRTTFRWSLAISSLLALLGLGGIVLTAHDTSVGAAYAAFVAALLVWGWQELAFLTGWITGPRRVACAPHCSGWPHFVHAVQAILWHELAIIGGGLLIAAIVWHGANSIALWTYVVLWVMRRQRQAQPVLRRAQSERRVPAAAPGVSRQFFRRRRMNPLMPLSVGAPAVVVVLLTQRALAPLTTEAQTAGLMLVAALLALAVLEHVLMVLPINATALWQWAMRTSAARPLPEPRIATAPAKLRPASRD